MILLMDSSEEERSNIASKNLCLVALGTKLPPMSETVVLIEVSCGGIQLVMTHENSVKKRVAQVAQDMEDTLPGMPIFVNTLSLSSSRTTLPKNMNVSTCVPTPQSWLGYRSTTEKHDTVNTVHIYKALQSEEKTIDRHCDTKQQDASLPDGLSGRLASFRLVIELYCLSPGLEGLD